jgi:hypothetical protein
MAEDIDTCFADAERPGGAESIMNFFLISLFSFFLKKKEKFYEMTQIRQQKESRKCQFCLPLPKPVLQMWRNKQLSPGGQI